jgi:cell surface protein SprA
VNLRANRSKSIYHNLNTEDITDVRVTDDKGAEIKGDWEIISKKRINFKPEIDASGARVTVNGKIERRDNPFVFIAENTALLLMSVKNVSASYTLTEGSSLAGYTRSTNMLGMDNQFNAPGWPFILGWQDENFAEDAIRNEWYVKDTLNIPYLMTSNKNLNFRASIEPFRGLKIDLTANRTHAENNSTFYYAENENIPVQYNEQITGNFSMTYITIGSAFEGISNGSGYYSKAYEEFKANRVIMSNRLAGKDGESADFQDGYGPNSQQVLVPAFQSAYGISDKNSIAMDLFQKIPLPNWSIKFDRLKDVEIIKKYFKSFNISHAYRSFYNVGSYINNTDYGFNPLTNDFVKDSSGNYIPLYNASGISINEQFSPLINVDMTMVNNLTARFEMKKSRTITLSFTNSQVTEVHSDELGFSIGYRWDDFDLIFNFGDGQSDFKSDLNIRANLKIRDTKTILRKISDETNMPSADQKVTIIGVSVDYMLSNRLSLRLFYDQNITDPLVGTSPYRTSNTDIGFSLRFTLTE